MTSSQKRKRDSGAPEEPASPTPLSLSIEKAESEVSVDVVPVDSTHFKLEWVSDRRPNKRAKKARDVTEPKHEDGIPGAGLGGDFVVMPGMEWSSLRKYRHFVVCPDEQERDDAKHKFESGRFVFVNHDEQPEQVVQSDQTSWVAYVKEVRAHAQYAVYLRVLWMYWPEELPQGRQPYHGFNELIASDFHQIIDAMTVSGKAQVHHLEDVHDLSSIPVDALYWRQTINVRGKHPRVSTLPKECICKSVSNPDDMQVRCPHCQEWQHETCLIENVLGQYWKDNEKPPPVQETTGGQDQNGTDEVIEDTIVAAPKRGLMGFASSISREFIGSLTGSRKSKAGRKAAAAKQSTKKRSSNADVAAGMDSPWGRTLTAKLQVEQENGRNAFTGKAVVYRIEETDGGTVLQDVAHPEVACLFCKESMFEPSDDKDVKDDDETEAKASTTESALFASSKPDVDVPDSVGIPSMTTKIDSETMLEAAAENILTDGPTLSLSQEFETAAA